MCLSYVLIILVPRNSIRAAGCVLLLTSIRVCPPSHRDPSQPSLSLPLLAQQAGGPKQGTWLGCPLSATPRRPGPAPTRALRAMGVCEGGGYAGAFIPWSSGGSTELCRVDMLTSSRPLQLVAKLKCQNTKNLPVRASTSSYN